jgi:hypothetical protein
VLHRGGGLHPGGVRPLPPERPTAPSWPGGRSLTLDGVMQATSRPDEDRRGGVAHGGKAQPYNDFLGHVEVAAAASTFPTRATPMCGPGCAVSAGIDVGTGGSLTRRGARLR